MKRWARLTGAALFILLTFTLLTPVTAAPRTRRYGPFVDPYASYVGQSKCSPKPKRGVVAFSNMVLKAYPWTGSYGISRDCSIGERSEHKEGRAWDWRVNARNDRDRAAADELIAWLLEDDKYGNRDARARRVGIMYLIFNRRMWSTWDGWETYCVMRKGVCRNDSGSAVHPHEDHVHFSFSWPGARKRTTFWNRGRSMVVDVEAEGAGDGYWLLGGNGGIRAYGAGNRGSKDGTFLRKPAVAMASTPTGGGYWMVTKKGKVFRFHAPRYGGVKRRDTTIADMAVRPQGDGYWLAAKEGRVFARGGAPDHGGNGRGVVAIASTGTGRGYWLFQSDGVVLPFGDAEFFGDASNRDLNSPIVDAAARGSNGYWLVTKRGRVYAYGGARKEGNLEAGSKVPPVSGIAAAATGSGYWLVGDMGRVEAFGTAQHLGQP